MHHSLHKTLHNLKPFNYEAHYHSNFINQRWILVNGLSNKKAIYIFKEDNILEIEDNETSITTTWSLSIYNIFTIETQDGIITVKAFFKDDDILVLNHQDKEDFALFVNTSRYKSSINSIDDVKLFLKEKYLTKVKHTISKHQFFYIAYSNEHGPFTVDELQQKVKCNTVSPYCFVRDINEVDYTSRLRILDLLQEV